MSAYRSEVRDSRAPDAPLNAELRSRSLFMHRTEKCVHFSVRCTKRAISTQRKGFRFSIPQWYVHVANHRSSMRYNWKRERLQ